MSIEAGLPVVSGRRTGADIVRAVGKRHLPAPGTVYRQGKRPLSAAPAPSIAAVSSAALLSAA